MKYTLTRYWHIFSCYWHHRQNRKSGTCFQKMHNCSFLTLYVNENQMQLFGFPYLKLQHCYNHSKLISTHLNPRLLLELDLMLIFWDSNPRMFWFENEKCCVYIPILKPANKRSYHHLWPHFEHDPQRILIQNTIKSKYFQFLLKSCTALEFS